MATKKTAAPKPAVSVRLSGAEREKHIAQEAVRFFAEVGFGGRSNLGLPRASGRLWQLGLRLSRLDGPRVGQAIHGVVCNRSDAQSERCYRQITIRRAKVVHDISEFL